MSVTQGLMTLGAWSLALDAQDADTFDHFEHIIITKAQVDLETLGDAGMLAASVYTGVIKKRGSDDAGLVRLEGRGLEDWLADSDGKGFVYETARAYVAETFANIINKASAVFGLLRDDAGAFVAIEAGTIHTVAGTLTYTAKLVSMRAAIQYVCESFGAEYRVNPDGTLDAGEESDLYTTTPTAVVAKDSGTDPAYEGVDGRLAAERDAEDYTTRALVVAEGEGDAVATGSADAGSVPYKDLFGNEVVKVRAINEAETSIGNADTRAQLHLNRFSGERKALTLTAGEYEVEGAFSVGDTIWVYDPAQGLYDLDNEISFRGRLLNPIAIRVLGHTWPIRKGMGVYHRDKDGTYTDLTPHVQWESGDAQILVGAAPRRLTSSGDPALSGRVNSTALASDEAIPDIPDLVGPFDSGIYLDSEGRTKAKIFVDWLQPLNTDGSTITDGSHYMVRWRIAGDSLYQYTAVRWATTIIALTDLSPGVTYEISVAAFDHGGRSAGFGPNESTPADADTIAPSQPAAPTLAGNPLYIQVRHQLGKNSGGTFNLEADIDHLNVYAAIASGFTPDNNHFLGQIPVTNGHLQLGIDVIGTFELPSLFTTQRFVKITAVDKAGNESTPSPEATVTAGLIDTQHITNLSVTNALIDNLAVTDAKVNDLSADKITAGEIDGHLITIVGGGRLRVNVVANQHVELGMVGPTPTNHAGLSLSEADYNNVFIRRLSDGVIFFRINSGGANSLTFDSSTGVLAITGTVNVTTGSVTGVLTVGGSIYVPSSSAANRVEMQGGARADIVLWSNTTASDDRGSLRGFSNGSEIFRIKPNFVAGSGLQYLYIVGSGYEGMGGHGVFMGSSFLNFEATGRRAGLAGLTPTASSAMLFATGGTGDTPVNFYQSTALVNGATHILIDEASHASGDDEFFLKMITRLTGPITNFSFRMDGRATAEGPGQGWYVDPDGGMFSPFDNTLGFEAGGTEILRLESAAVRVLGTAGSVFLGYQSSPNLAGGVGDFTAFWDDDHASGWMVGTTASDRQLKKNIRDYQGDPALFQVPLREYELRANQGHRAEETRRGMIADELEAIAPHLVVEIDGIKRIKDGQPLQFEILLALQDLERRIGAIEGAA